MATVLVVGAPSVHWPALGFFLIAKDDAKAPRSATSTALAASKFPSNGVNRWVIAGGPEGRVGAWLGEGTWEFPLPWRSGEGASRIYL